MSREARLHGLHQGIFQLSTGDQNGYLIDLGAGDSGREATWVWIDPGPQDAVPDLLGAAGELLGEDLRGLGLLVSSHLDASGLGAVPELCRRAPRAKVLMTQETWNFAALTGIPETRVAIAERFRGGFRLPTTGRGLEILLTPYAQYTGAFLLYESRSASLFSADLFAGGSSRHDAPWAEEDDWTRVAEFQRRHMPCSAALAWSLARIAALPRLELVCPHHGGLLRGEVLRRFLERIEGLEVGADLLAGRREATPQRASQPFELSFDALSSFPPPT